MLSTTAELSYQPMTLVALAHRRAGLTSVYKGANNATRCWDSLLPQIVCFIPHRDDRLQYIFHFNTTKVHCSRYYYIYIILFLYLRTVWPSLIGKVNLQKLTHHGAKENVKVTPYGHAQCMEKRTSGDRPRRPISPYARLGPHGRR